MRIRQSVPWSRILKGLLLYAFVPLLCLRFLAQPVGSAVRRSGPAAFWILLAALGVVCAGWAVYAALHRRRPSLPVFAHGVACLLLVLIVEYEALLNDPDGPSSTLAVIGGCLALVLLFLLSFWFSSSQVKTAHAAAVVLWVVIGFIFVFMLYRVVRDFESRTVSVNTWITAVILAALVPAAFSRRISSSARRKRFRRSAEGLAEGKILQIIGETRLDLDGDPVTGYHALIRYTVGGVDYETRADISALTWRWFGKEAFIGQDIPVHYDPENPRHAYADRIDRHFFDS